MMGTPLQNVYDCFLGKIDENMINQENLIFEFFKTALSRAYKYCPHDLTYTLNNNSKVIVVTNIALVSGDITLIINNISHTVSVLNTDSNNQIINKINLLITSLTSPTYTTIEYLIGNYPSLTIIQDTGIIDNFNYIDSGITGLGLEIIDSYDGCFDNELNQDEIELIALYMKEAHLSKSEQYWVALRNMVSTKDFNSLPDKKRILDGIQNSKKMLKEEIDDFKQQFFDYKYN